MKKQTVEIPLYIRKVKLSNKRITKYYESTKVGPKAKKYANREQYDYVLYKSKTRKFLTDLKTGERVIANPLAQGTPKYIVVNGQKLYNGEMNPMVRRKVMAELKEQMGLVVDKMTELDPKDFPIRIEMELHDVIREPSSHSLWDLDNRAYPYVKAFQDCLTGNRDRDGKKRNKQVIPDDNILFITSPPTPTFIPVESEEDRKLVFTLVKETDKRIVTNPEFMAQLKEQLDEITRIHKRSQQDLAQGRRTKGTSSLQARSGKRDR